MRNRSRQLITEKTWMSNKQMKAQPLCQSRKMQIKVTEMLVLVISLTIQNIDFCKVLMKVRKNRFILSHAVVMCINWRRLPLRQPDSSHNIHVECTLQSSTPTPQHPPQTKGTLYQDACALILVPLFVMGVKKTALAEWLGFSWNTSEKESM